MTLIYTDAMVDINGLDMSDHVRTVNLTYEAEILDDTAMGTSGTRSAKPGLKGWNVTVEFYQDFAAGSTDAVLFPLIGANPFPIRIRPVKSVLVSDTNPEFQGLAVLESYPPLTGEVGALGMASASLRAGGGSPLTRVIA